MGESKGSSVNIFPDSGNITKISVPNAAGEVFIRISSSDGKSAPLFGSAPITGLSVVRSTDYGLIKAANNDFYVTAFGDAPVAITISGLSIIGTVVDCTGSGESKDKDKKDQESYNPLSLYKEYSTTEASEPLYLDISTVEGVINTFKCFITGLTMQCSPDDTSRQFATYSITLIGVDKV